MKTIFISLFEGVEAKNILRTDIIPTLLANPQVRLVLLMKSNERIELYRKEFHDPRLVYAVVPYARSRGHGFDRVFAVLKYALLRTRSTALQRRRAYESGGSFAAYVAGLAVNFLLARAAVRTAVRWLDFLLVRNTLYAEVFDAYRPDIVFLAHLFEEPEIHILREAKRRGITTIGFINSWDKLTERAMIRLLPDHAVVFNDLNRDELIVHNEMDPRRIFVGGIPQYDMHIRGNVSTREDFFRRIQCDPARKLVVYATNISMYSDSDWQTIDLLHELNRAGAFGETLNILVRFRPTDLIDATELKKRPHVHYDYPGVRLSAGWGVDWDMDKTEEAHLRDTLHWMDLLICYSSSLTVDAVLFDKPVININFDPRESANSAQERIRFYNYTKEHYAKALASGGIRLVQSEEELIQWVRRYLKDPAADAAGRKRLVEEQCQFLDGCAGERIGKFILANLR